VTITALLFGQSGSKWIFDDSVLPEVRVSINESYLDEILDPDNKDSDHEFLASFSFTKNEETEVVDSVGFRLRGNTSRASKKKSFKVSFDTFIDGREYRGAAPQARVAGPRCGS
jgi:spore coat protein CotH